MADKKEGLYTSLLKAGKQAIEEMQVPFKVRAAEKDLEKEIIDIESKIADADLAIYKTKGEHPINLKKILKAIDDKELLERQLKQATALKAELF